jgi:hypothetical protein
MASYIRAIREENAIKICLTEKFHYAYSPYALNKLYLALTQ